MSEKKLCLTHPEVVVDITFETLNLVSHFMITVAVFYGRHLYDIMQGKLGYNVCFISIYTNHISIM